MMKQDIEGYVYTPPSDNSLAEYGAAALQLVRASLDRPDLRFYLHDGRLYTDGLDIAVGTQQTELTADDWNWMARHAAGVPR